MPAKPPFWLAAEPLLPVTCAQATSSSVQQAVEPLLATEAPAHPAAEPLLPVVCAQATSPSAPSAPRRNPGALFPPLIARPPVWLVATTLGFCLALTLVCTVFDEQLASQLHADSGAAARLLLLKAVSIPSVSVVFTYCHIWLALWMTFLPIEFVGCLRIPHTNVGLGWQGIVPFKAIDFAIKACDNMIPGLISPEECVGRITAEGLVAERRLQTPISVLAPSPLSYSFLYTFPQQGYEPSSMLAHSP